MLPAVVYKPPFNITRASHVTLTVADLEASRAFYVDVVGLVVSDETDDLIYLRGLEEACHHSLVLRRSKGTPVCARVGFRVFLDEDLDAAKDYFDATGLPTSWEAVPYQGRTLHVRDGMGIPLELCSRMETRPRLYTQWEAFKGAHAQCFDHVQALVPDTYAACDFYSRLGFRLSEYIADGEALVGAFMYRKGTLQDMVFLPGTGPRLHHFAYTVPESHNLFAACDLAGNLGWGQNLERGPGRHGPGGVLFAYFRDPDGHRVELFCNHYQTIDVEIEPVRWEGRELNTNIRWGLPALAKWYFEATPFEGTAPVDPPRRPDPQTLEKYVMAQAAASAESRRHIPDATSEV